MHKILLITLSFGAYCAAFAQEVVASQGESYSGATAKVDFTIGEVVINTGLGATVDLTQGFHQTNWKFTGLEDNAPELAILVYPNPASDFLHIQTSDFKNITFALYDEAGRLVAQDRLSEKTTAVRVGELAAGNYSLVLSDETHQLKLFKLIKSL